MRRVSADELIAQLAEVHREVPDGILASDCDNTLWRGDVGDALIDTALEEKWLRPAVLPALLAEAREHAVAVDDEGDPNAVAAALLGAYRAKRYPPKRTYSMVAWALAGHSEAELAARADDVVARFDVRQALRPSMRAVFDWARGVGIDIWLVSASPAPVVAAACRALSLEARVVAMEPAIVAGEVAPRLATEPTFGPGKVARLRRETQAPLIAGFGDSDYDAALMHAARVAVALAPRDSLRAIAPDDTVELV